MSSPRPRKSRSAIAAPAKAASQPVFKKLLVANRSEIAIRVFRAATELDLRTVAIYAQEDRLSVHRFKADEAYLVGQGKGPVAAYLDIDGIVALAKEKGVDLVHPGYGFLSENAGFARRCAAAGLTFVGPDPATLDLFGDKAEGRSLAQRCDVPVLAGTTGPTTLDEAAQFLASLGEGGAVIVKALAGGAGRGMRAVEDPAELADAYARCRSEAEHAFGNGDVYVE